MKADIVKDREVMEQKILDAIYEFEEKHSYAIVSSKIIRTWKTEEDENISPSKWVQRPAINTEIKLK